MEATPSPVSLLGTDRILAVATATTIPIITSEALIRLEGIIRSLVCNLIRTIQSVSRVLICMQ